MTATHFLDSVLPKTLRNAANELRSSHSQPTKRSDSHTSGNSKGAEAEAEGHGPSIEREVSNDSLEHSHSRTRRDKHRPSSDASVFLTSWEQNKRPLSPEDIVSNVDNQRLGGRADNVSIDDFDLVKTLGTGTFARVWLAKFKKENQHDRNQAFALKVLRKADIIRLKQVEHVQNERRTLAATAGHPFITTLIFTFSDRDCLYMLLDYCPGGEVFSYLRRARKFEEPTAKFYAAEMTLIFEFLHDTRGIVYRDLKPENILLDSRGHLKLVDFGFAKQVSKHETYTLCGTPEYLAPEVIKNTGHSMGTDWWALGILIYEFLVGQPPFWSQNPMNIYHMIVECKLRFPSDKNAMSDNARDIISQLLQPQPSHRLGCISGGARAVKEHPWFAGVDWDLLYYKKMDGPIVPKLKSDDDCANFDDYPDEDVKQRKEYGHRLKAQYDHAFDEF